MTSPSAAQVTRLLTVAHDRSLAGREMLACMVGDLFHDRHAVLTERERLLMHDILAKLIHDVELSVRSALSARLAGHADVPPDVIAALAGDDIAVAHPILVESPVLRDFELVEIIRHRSLQHQLAITLRNEVSEAVSDALVDTGRAEVIASLLENGGARIADETMARVVEESQAVEALQPPLVRRQDLSPALARRLCLWVSAALRQHLISRYEIDEGMLDDALQAAARTAVGDEDDEDDTPRHSAEDRRFAIATLMQSLRRGDVPMFEAVLTKLSGLRPTLIRRMVYEPGGESLAAICVACGIGKAEFAAIFVLSRKTQPDRDVVDSQEVAAAIAFFDELDPAAARKVVQRWRRDPAYLRAVRQVASG